MTFFLFYLKLKFNEKQCSLVNFFLISKTRNYIFMHEVLYNYLKMCKTRE